MVLYEVISKRSNVVEGNLTIERLNNLLDQLSKIGGKMYIHLLPEIESALTSVSLPPGSNRLPS